MMQEVGFPPREDRPLWRERVRLDHEREAHHRRRQAGIIDLDALFDSGLEIKVVLKASGLWKRGLRNANDVRLVRLEWSFEHLPEAFDGYSILQLSDLHIDLRPGYVEALVNLLDPIEADLCVLTGDFRFRHFGPIDEAVAGMARLLPALHGRDGVYAILGNHDPYTVVEPYERLGITWLLNENVRLERGDDSIRLAGVDDPHHYRTYDVPLAFHGISEGDFVVFLAHTPEIFEEAERAGAAMYLCGHTHGGQIRFPWLGALRLNARAPRSHCQGAWRHGAMRGYTSFGIGTTMVPVRYNCPPEAVLITLRRSPASPRLS